MAERYKCTLSPELLKTAVDELNEPEDNDVRLAAIDKLKTRFQEEAGDLELIRTDDAFLLRYLRVRKFDQDRALKTLINYHRQRIEWKEVFDMVDNPKPLERILGVGPVIPLSNRAKDGTFVIIDRMGYGLEENDTILMHMACVMLNTEKMLENEEVQIKGVTVVGDMIGLSASLALQMAAQGRRFMHTVQDCLPVRTKSINMVNEALVFDIIYAILKQFMSEKMKNRLQLHGSVFDTLHEKIDPCYLPSFLGGTGPDLDAGAWKRELLSTLGEGEDTSL